MQRSMLIFIRLQKNNDGLHEPEEKVETLELATGKHELKLNYFQGPRYEIALELYWSTPSDLNKQIVPAQVFSRQ